MFAWGESLVDHLDLRRVDRQHAGKPVSAGFFGGAFEPLGVGKVGVERVDRHHPAGVRGQQRLGAGIAERISPAALAVAFAGGADRGRQVFGDRKSVV